MRPASGVSNPAISRSNVVLPQPEGPSNAKNSPRSTETDTPSTAVAAPNRFSASMISSSAIRGCSVIPAQAGIQGPRVPPPALDPERDLDPALRLARAVERLDHIARIAERDAQIAGRQIVNILRGMEFPDIGPYPLDQLAGAFEIAGVAALRVKPKIRQRRRK